MTHTKRTLLISWLLACSSACFAAAEPPPLGEPGLSATYRIGAPAPAAGSVVKSFMVEFGPAARWQETHGQWLHLEARKQDGGVLEVWLLCSQYPEEALEEAQSSVLRYVLKTGDAAPAEYRHEITHRAVLPGSGGWPYLLPRAAGAEGAAEAHPFAERVSYLGHRYTRETLAHAAPAEPPEDWRLVMLRPDVLMGVPHDTRQVDETRRYDNSDYAYVPLTEDDHATMVAAGINCFRAAPEQVAWFENAGVFYWGVQAADMGFPECLYRPLYIGPALFLNEPAVVTRDHALRPRLREEPAFRQKISVGHALDAFKTHYAEVMESGPPVRLMAGLAGRDDVDLGTMRIRQANLYSWETMVSSAAYQLLAGPVAPGAIVFEPPGQLGTRRTLPGMNMSYGCQIPVTGEDHFIDIIIGFLRGAARASGKEWGISIYGGVDRTEAAAFFSRAYELGATRFFFWDSHKLACVPFGEVLALCRHVDVHAQNYPQRDLDRLRNAAEVAILLPPGYNLGHVHMGKGILWGLDELNLERRNRDGVRYRAVMRNFFTEVERCIRLGAAFDLLWDLPELPLEGYREVVRVREDGKVEVLEGEQRAVLDSARTPPRSAGAPPTLRVEGPKACVPAPCSITVSARVLEGDAPVYYAPAPDRRGVHHNQRVAWELYGPSEADYAYRAPAVVPGAVTPHPEGGHTAEVRLHLTAPGVYRLRAAATDLAGRSSVVWRELHVGE